jgi:hypothetical protein
VSIRARAERLFEALGDRAPREPLVPARLGPIHANGARFDRATPRGRAAWDVALVLEDPAADVHNAPYARLLLDAAERFVGSSNTPAVKFAPGAPSAAPTGVRR